MAKKIVCKTCGSEDVYRDAWARWNGVEWEMSSIFDYSWCAKCNGETSLVEIKE